MSDKHRASVRMVALVAGAFVLLSIGSAAYAARGSDVTGSIALAGDPVATAAAGGGGMSHGDTAFFAYSVDGKLSPKGYTYINVVCVQGETVVYQVSKWTDGLYFEADVDSGFELSSATWGEGPATCYGTLVYRIDGRKPTIDYLDQTVFTVG